MFLKHSLIISYFQKQAAKAPVFGTELAKLLSDTGDEGSNPAFDDANALVVNDADGDEDLHHHHLGHA